VASDPAGALGLVGLIGASLCRWMLHFIPSKQPYNS
jgi:hypothetical protein